MGEKRLTRMIGHLRSDGFNEAALAAGSTEYYGDSLPHGTATIATEHFA